MFLKTIIVIQTVLNVDSVGKEHSIKFKYYYSYGRAVNWNLLTAQLSGYLHISSKPVLTG